MSAFTKTSEEKALLKRLKKSAIFANRVIKSTSKR